MSLSLTSQHNGLKLDVGGPKQHAYLKASHEGTLFEGNSFTNRIVGTGANFKDGVRQPDEPDTLADTDVNRARKRMNERETQRAEEAAAPDLGAIEAAETAVDAPPKLTAEESAAILNAQLFGKAIPPDLTANVRKFKAGTEVKQRGARAVK